MTGSSRHCAAYSGFDDGSAIVMTTSLYRTVSVT